MRPFFKIDLTLEFITYIFKNPKSIWSKNNRPTKFKEGDLPFEPPKSIDLRREYDEGPGDYAALLINYFNSVKEFKDLFPQDLSFGPQEFTGEGFKTLNSSY